MFHVYILASKRNGTLYIGVTKNLVKRISDHRSGLIKGFTKKYEVHNLVFYESTTYFQAAVIKRETAQKVES